MKKKRRCEHCNHVHSIKICLPNCCPCREVTEDKCLLSDSYIDPFKELVKKLWEEIDESAENKSE